MRDELSSDVDKELSVHQRLYDAKMRRIDEAQRRKQRGSAFGELERIYKAELELLQARLRSAEAELGIRAQRRGQLVGSAVPRAPLKQRETASSAPHTASTVCACERQLNSRYSGVLWTMRTILGVLDMSNICLEW